MHEDHSSHGAPSGEKYELSDVHVRIILYTGIVLTVTVLATFVVSYYFLKNLDETPAATRFKEPSIATAVGHEAWTTPVRLQQDPPAEYQEYKHGQTSLAESFAQVSLTPEIYRIPIATAMKIVEEKGFPVFPMIEPVAPTAETEAVPVETAPPAQP